VSISAPPLTSRSLIRSLFDSPRLTPEGNPLAGAPRPPPFSS
jgi:hypothetical protein